MLIVSVQSSKRRHGPEKVHMDAKRQRRAGEASDGPKEEEEDEEERLAEEKLKELQSLAEKSVREGDNIQPSSLSSKACAKSSWEQIGSLMVYTAAGVGGSDKVGVDSVEDPMIILIYLWI